MDCLFYSKIPCLNRHIRFEYRCYSILELLYCIYIWLLLLIEVFFGPCSTSPPPPLTPSFLIACYHFPLQSMPRFMFCFPTNYHYYYYCLLFFPRISHSNANLVIARNALQNHRCLTKFTTFVKFCTFFSLLPFNRFRRCFAWRLLPSPNSWCHAQYIVPYIYTFVYNNVKYYIVVICVC